MSPRLRRLSGRQVIAVPTGLSFEPVAQRGSHVKLRRITEKGTKETLTDPNHQELDIGTLRAIVRQAARYVSERDLREHFYSD